VLAVVLVRKYLRTHDIGFIWLAVAVVLWPLSSRLLDQGEGVLIGGARHGQSVFCPFTLITSGHMTAGRLVFLTGAVQQLIGVGLLLVAALYLCKPKLQAAA
jgi:hypothetical protein